MKVTCRQSEIIFVSYFHPCVSLFDFSCRYQLKADGFATELSWWVRDDWGPESHSGMGFSTPLQDNDASSENCAAETLSAFWYFFFLCSLNCFIKVCLTNQAQTMSSELFALWEKLAQRECRGQQGDLLEVIPWTNKLPGKALSIRSAPACARRGW